MSTTVGHSIGFALALLVIGATHAAAQPSTEHGASIIEFPKVVADGVRDTVIQVVNITNSGRHVHCFYENGALTNPALPPSPSNPPVWQTSDFSVSLTAQQPISWVASSGRTPPPPCDTNPSLPECAADPGPVPPVSSLPFDGELLCIEVDAATLPVSGNALIGEATVKTLGSGDVAKYNAIGFAGLDTNNADNTLCLGGSVTADCPNGAEYAACPQAWTLDHLATGAEDGLIGAGSAVRTDLTVVPCSHDFVTQTPQTVVLQFQITNELEQLFASSTTVTCWQDIPLIDIAPTFGIAALGTVYAQTRITPAISSGGFMVVAEEFHDSAPAGLTASAAVNVHVEGARTDGDRIFLPN